MFHLLNYSLVFPTNHNNHEEVFYIINGTGKIKVGHEEARLRDGDIIYIPENTAHSIINDGEEMLKFLVFGGYTGKQKKKRSRKQK
jgi:mannose-6-phosphate isomerase-like protein (cupin superfamily)